MINRKKIKKETRKVEKLEKIRKDVEELNQKIDETRQLLRSNFGSKYTFEISCPRAKIICPDTIQFDHPRINLRLSVQYC